MDTFIESRFFTRALEILPGALAWLIIFFPFIASPFWPLGVAIFVIIFDLYWVSKLLNMLRHLIGGHRRMDRNMKIKWLSNAKKVSNNYQGYLAELEAEYARKKNKYLKEDIQILLNSAEVQEPIKPWRDIYHVVIITNYRETFKIAKPTYDAIKNSDYPNDRMIVVGTGEWTRDREGWEKVQGQLKKEYGTVFAALLFNNHEDKPGEVKGKGPNLYSAGKMIAEYLKNNFPKVKPEDVIVTTLDADHIAHQEYFGKLTYEFIIDPNRLKKTYQPVGLLMNNIWDAPAPNRLTAISTSFWQLMEGMRPYRLRTFASHSQSLDTLLKTDFWSTKTIVEDGHQYWRTYFAFGGDHYMSSILIPIYQDCVLAESFIETFKNQYNQRKRWAYGVSDFPFVVKKSIEHKEIPLFERLLQIFRLISGHISWSTASLLLAFAWMPLIFNNDFYDMVLVHNIMTYGSTLMKVAWIGLIVNAWVFLSILPERPAGYGKHRYIGMVLQWALMVPVSIVLNSFPALEAQTQLMFGKYLDVFWLTPKYRKGDPITGAQKK